MSEDVMSTKMCCQRLNLTISRTECDIIANDDEQATYESSNTIAIERECHSN